MGADIHLYVEKRNEQNKWECAYGRFYPEVGFQEFTDPQLTQPFTWEHPFAIGRNYDLFSTLAEVRQRDDIEHVPLPSISGPRGLPGNASKVIRKESKRWGEDGHSHSYHTLRELLEFDWIGATYASEGYLTVIGTKLLEKLGVSLPAWNAKRLPHVKKEEAMHVAFAPEFYQIDSDISSETNSPANTTWERFQSPVIDEEIKFRATLRLSLSFFVEDVIEELKKLGEPDDVRIVFWFDN